MRKIENVYMKKIMLKSSYDIHHPYEISLYKRYNNETEEYLSDFGICRYLNQGFSMLKETIE